MTVDGVRSCGSLIKQMKVLGHDHVAEDDKLIPLSYLAPER